VIQVLIAHHGLMRASVRMALGDESEVCGEAGGADQAILEAQRAQPDVCILGWDLPGGGLAAIHGILTVSPDTSVVVLSEHRDVEDLLAAVRAGAVGYLPGSLDKDQLCRVVRGVVAQEAAVPRAMVRELILELRSATAMGGVTEREAQVLGMLRRGHTTAEIARRLEISPITVRRYISDLMRKLGVDNREDLMRLDRGGDRSSSGGAGPRADRFDRDVRGHRGRRQDATADCAV
jgi:two-component system nitrate/nitrite response regulator NarL